MAGSEEEVERLWEGEEEEMDEEDKDWLIQRLREKDIRNVTLLSRVNFALRVECTFLLDWLGAHCTS